MFFFFFGWGGVRGRKRYGLCIPKIDKYMYWQVLGRRQHGLCKPDELRAGL